MRITHKPKTLWYEGINGEIFTYDKYSCEHPKGAKFQISQFPTALHIKCLGLNDDGQWKEVYSGNLGYSEDLVMAMANSGDYKLGEAILIAAHACERCTNVLGHQYGLPWGYPEHGAEWRRARTVCEYCRDEDSIFTKAMEAIMRLGRRYKFRWQQWNT